MTEKQQRQITSSMRVKGQVGGASTDRSYNYKLRATWITPGVARAAARLLMLSKGFSDRQANEVVQAVTTAGACLVKLVLVELDPREGSGVIPKDWLARFGPRG